jgi:MazG family protein
VSIQHSRRNGKIILEMQSGEPTHVNGFKRLCDIVAQLRAPGGCPWDREQTHESLLSSLLEETYEVIGAVRAGDNANLREELGDLFLQIVMHAEIAREAHRFDIDEVIKGVTTKLIRRHPHVFGASSVPDSGAVLKQWEAIKREEKSDQSVHYLDSLPAALPALLRAQKAQNKAARVNFDWEDLNQVVAKVEEELHEAKAAIEAGDREAIADEIGDLFFAIVNLTRKSKLDAETVLQAGTDKFVRRFSEMEDELGRSGQKLGEANLAELDAIWDRLKGR